VSSWPRRARRVVITLAASALVAVAVAVAMVRIQAAHSAEHRAASYLHELATGDFTAAFEGTTVPRYALEAKPDELIAEPKVVATTTQGTRARATVSYRLAGRTHTTTITLAKHGGGPFPKWAVTTPLAGDVTVSVRQPPGLIVSATYTIGGANATGAFAPADGDSEEYRSGHLTLAPGRYTLTGRVADDVMRAAPVSVLVPGTGGTGGVGVTWSLTAGG